MKQPGRVTGGENTSMATTNVDLLPPYGEPEVQTTGKHADEVAWVVLGLVFLLALAYYG